ncbi:ATP phosphoribosyltransferase regulatory subunit [Motiliproteus sp. SC1-56]|uniref:ATP phosphoribosyltransferase regulatory subunit n=1 Tax=Motiliproteus sp. SC1-56 TaxID=2799565 RepID=UPI001A905073|nr:ATP phosphoribosyltransferase regulatory subunit [Motiliproteus sp. SC1-56]
MSIADRWLLPDGVNEILPPEAWRVERQRRLLLDLFHSWGYDLVMPPLVEFLESLLTGTGNDLDLNTFKVTDQLTGRLMGLRADTTPQVARIDAHSLNHQMPTRLCYANSVLHTRAANMLASRTPLQIGAELYGHAGVESDIEVICLMLETLRHAGIDNLTLDLGHVAFYRALVDEAGLEPDQQSELFNLLQGKALTEYNALLERLSLDAPLLEKLRALPALNGDQAVLARAQALFGAGKGAVAEALADLERIADTVSRRFPGVALYFDLSELRGYNYHTGVVFAAFTPGYGQPLAKGGRYDEIGKVFGRARPATGFSADLKVIVEQAPRVENQPRAILAPLDKDPGLGDEVARLRGAGERVLYALPGQETLDAEDLGCDRRLVQRDGHWRVVPF